MSARVLDLADIQGNVVRAYSAWNYPVARFFCLHVADAEAGRAFIDAARTHVTTAERWVAGSKGLHGAAAIPRPDASLNIALSYRGLEALDVPTRTLARFPAEFIDGMGARAELLGDVNASAFDNWDPVWRASPTTRARSENDVHILLGVYAKCDRDGEPVPAFEAMTDMIRSLCEASKGGVRILAGHGPDGADHQFAKALMIDTPEGKRMTGNEHFGFRDGIGNPIFEGQMTPEEEKEKLPGRGRLMPRKNGAKPEWRPLAAGEFLLGHPDESQETPPQAPPWEFTRNGSFMAFRKLHQNVHAFQTYTKCQARPFAKIFDLTETAAEETIRAKMAGRWSDGAPLIAAPDHASWKLFQERYGAPAYASPEAQRALADFLYEDDQDGVKCPFGAHLRRANTRDMLDPTLHDPKANRAGSALNMRRRILRRGLPYGSFDPSQERDDAEHGIIFIALCSDLFRQFEFVQRQWMNYGLDFEAGGDTCPLVGDRSGDAKFVIPSADETKPPFICANMPEFVETRGGEYFFVPSLTALRMLADGSIDPT